MNLAGGWTGRTACALQQALHLSNDAFAAKLGIGARTVGAWHQKPALRPQSEMQQILDTTLEQASLAVQGRFAELIGKPAQRAAVDEGAAADAERRLSADPSIGSALDWLDAHSGWQPGTARRRVASWLGRLDIRDLRDRESRRARVDQRQIALALAEYYRDSTMSHGIYRANCGDQTESTTSILTNPEWLDINCPLVFAHDRLAVTGTSMTPNAGVSLDEESSEQAVRRLAETLTSGVRLIDMPLYQLLDVNVRKGEIAGAVGVVRFVDYALTLDLLEGELIDAVAVNRPTLPGSLPLRDKYLPDLGSVVNLSGRLCTGGALALCAIARPASSHRGEADYLLLVQERSGHVVNAARRLAVIPKGFHQPMVDYRADAQIAATLRREMEEELFGRDDIDNTIADGRLADPMHPSRLSEPMRWLTNVPGRLRMECTGFGLNLVSGNYEFASLIVVEDEDFWSRYGGQIEANWESLNLQQYSSLDAPLLTGLIGDVGWSNEGLFALLQGLRRLAEIGGRRVNVPPIEWEVC